MDQARSSGPISKSLSHRFSNRFLISLLVIPFSLRRRFVTAIHPKGHVNSTRNIPIYTYKTAATMGGVLCRTLLKSISRDLHVLGT